MTAGDWQVQSLQPLSEIKADHETRGGSIELSKVVDLQEMGVPDGLVGTVTSISACPAIECGPGRVVLATVNHLNDFVFHLTLTDGRGDEDTIGITGYHKVYTEDRGWVIASELRRGEEVRTATGDVRVSKLIHDPGAFTVYNLTVERDHDYYVGDFGALVHNICPVPPNGDGALSTITNAGARAYDQLRTAYETAQAAKDWDVVESLGKALDAMESENFLGAFN